MYVYICAYMFVMMDGLMDRCIQTWCTRVYICYSVCSGSSVWVLPTHCCTEPYPVLVVAEHLNQSLVYHQVNNGRLVALHDRHRFGRHVRVPQTNRVVNAARCDDVQLFTVIETIHALEADLSHCIGKSYLSVYLLLLG